MELFRFAGVVLLAVLAMLYFMAGVYNGRLRNRFGFTLLYMLTSAIMGVGSWHVWNL